MASSPGCRHIAKAEGGGGRCAGAGMGGVFLRARYPYDETVSCHGLLGGRCCVRQRGSRIKFPDLETSDKDVT